MLTDNFIYTFEIIKNKKTAVEKPLFFIVLRINIIITKMKKATIILLGISIMICGCSKTEKSEILGCWEIVSYYISDKQVTFIPSWEIILNNDGTCFSYNKKAIYLDSCDWIFNDSTSLVFSKEMFSLHNECENNDSESKPTICEIQKISDSTLELKLKKTVDGELQFCKYILKRKDVNRDNFTERFNTSKYIIQDHTRNRDHTIALRAIVKKMVMNQYDNNIYLLSDSIVEILDSWKSQLPTKSGGYRYCDRPWVIYHSPNTKINLLNLELKGIAKFMSLYSRLCVQDSLINSSMNLHGDSLKLRSLFSKFSNEFFYKDLKNTPYEIKNRNKDDTVLILMNDIEQTKISILLNCIKILTDRHKK